jgi:hypothetical protein
LSVANEGAGKEDRGGRPETEEKDRREDPRVASTNGASRTTPWPLKANDDEMYIGRTTHIAHIMYLYSLTWFATKETNLDLKNKITTLAFSYYRY